MDTLIRLGAKADGVTKVSYIITMSSICDLICLQGEMTPLHRAAQHNHVAVVETLITAGADIHAVDKVCIKYINQSLVHSFKLNLNKIYLLL